MVATSGVNWIFVQEVIDFPRCTELLALALMHHSSEEVKSFPDLVGAEQLDQKDSGLRTRVRVGVVGVDYFAVL